MANNHIITIAHTKGGVGKSTIAWNLANALVADQKEVTIIDLDFQQTLFFVNHIRASGEHKGLNVIQPEPQDLITLLNTLTGTLIIDVGGFDNDINRLAITYADKIVVPLSHSVTEILGFKTFEAILEEIGPKAPVHILLNNIHPLVKNFDLMTEALQGHHILNAIIRNRKTYKETMGNGKSVFDTKDTIAIQEIQRLKDELVST